MSISASIHAYVGRQITCAGHIPSIHRLEPLRETARQQEEGFCYSIPSIPSRCRFEWKKDILVPMRDQGLCASCWAFTVTDMLADRISIYTNNEHREHLSVQYLLACYNKHFGCGIGGSPEDVYEFIERNGVLYESDYPYEQFDKTGIAPCKMPSGSALPARRVSIRNGSYRDLCQSSFTIGDLVHQQNIKNMQTEILLNGPITGTINVYTQLYDYQGAHTDSGGINIIQNQERSGGTYYGGHSCEIFGWNSIHSIPYWIVRASWGDDWPKKGFGSIVYVKMGTNESGIESRASCAIPVLPAHIQPRTTSRSMYIWEV